MGKEGFDVAFRVKFAQGAPKLTVYSLEDSVVIVGGKTGIWKIVPVGIRNSKLFLRFESLGAAFSRTWDVAVFVVEMVRPAWLYLLRRHIEFGPGRELNSSREWKSTGTSNL